MCKYLKRGWIRSRKNDVSIAGGDTWRRFKYDRWDALPCLANCRERVREQESERERERERERITLKLEREGGGGSLGVI